LERYAGGGGVNTAISLEREVSVHGTYRVYAKNDEKLQRILRLAIFQSSRHSPRGESLLTPLKRWSDSNMKNGRMDNWTYLGGSGSKGRELSEEMDEFGEEKLEVLIVKGVGGENSC